MKSRILFLIALALLLVACNLDSQNLGLSGNMIGYVVLHDLNGFTLQEDTGITLAVEGGGYTIVTNTDSAGEWEIAGLTTGSYNIIVSKSGFGTYKLLDFQFAGGGQAHIGTIDLYQIPPLSVTGLSDSVADGALLINGSFSGTLPSAQNAHAYVFLGKSPTVSSDPGTYLTYLPVENSSNGRTFSVNYGNDTTRLLNAGFATGQTVYVVAYGSSFNPIGYIDSTTNRAVFTGLNPVPSNLDSFTVP
jgi:hypothetical protein